MNRPNEKRRPAAVITFVDPNPEWLLCKLHMNRFPNGGMCNDCFTMNQKKARVLEQERRNISWFKPYIPRMEATK